jgi:hypothetical protein
MAFNLPQFLRRTPRDSLRSYFAFRSITLAVDVDWSAAQRAFLDVLRAVVENLPDGERERVFQDFESADILADEPGQLAVRSLFSENAPFVLAVEGMANGEARSLAALMENEAFFRKALVARLADRLRTGRSWSGFLIAPTAGALREGQVAAGLASFEADMRAIFVKLDGSGRKLSIDRFERDRPGTSGRFTQYTVFIEGLPQASNEFEADRLVPRARRPVFEAALCHDPAAGTIDIVCKGGRGVRLDIARAFMHRLLGSESDPKAVRLRSVNLDGLKSRMTFARDPGDGVRRVAVILLRLRDADESFGRITLEVGSEADDEDIWTRSGEWFEDFDPLTYANWSVTQASLRIEFHPEKEGGPAKVMTVDLRTPHGTNLKDLPRRYATVIEKNLLRWGLLRDASA